MENPLSIFVGFLYVQRKPDHKVDDFIENLCGSYQFLYHTSFPFSTPFRGKQLSECEIDCEENETIEYISDGVRTKKTKYRLNGEVRVRTSQTFESTFYILYCIEQTKNILYGYILKSDYLGNLSLDERFLNQTLSMCVNGLTNNEIGEKIVEHHREMSNKFEDTHRINLIEKQNLQDKSFHQLPLYLQKKLIREQVCWEEERERINWDLIVNGEDITNDGIYPYYYYDDYIDITVLDSCSRKNRNMSNHHKKGIKDKKKHRF